MFDVIQVADALRRDQIRASALDTSFQHLRRLNAAIVTNSAAIHTSVSFIMICSTSADDHITRTVCSTRQNYVTIQRVPCIPYACP
jgi:hypothetical protein